MPPPILFPLGQRQGPFLSRLTTAVADWAVPARLFRDSFDRANQANLGTADSPAVVWKTDALSSILSNKARFALGASAASNVWLTPAQIAIFDFDAEITFVASNVTSWDSEFLLRVAEGAETWVRVGFSPTAFFIAEKLEGVTSSLATTAFTVVAATTYRVRFQGVGSQLRAKVWINGAAEPSTWDLSTTTAVLRPGGVGLFQFASTAVNIDWDDLTIGEPGYFDTSLTTVTPSTLALTLGTFAPVDQFGIIAGLATLTTAAFAPVDQFGIIAGLATLTTTAFAPVDQFGIVVPVKTLTTATFAPVDQLIVQVPLVTLVTSLLVPSVFQGTVVVAGLATLTTTAFAPVDQFGIVIPVKVIVTTAFAPVDQLGVVVPVAALVLTGFAPDLGASLLVTPGPLGLVVARYVPSILVVNPNLDALTLGVLTMELWGRGKNRQRDHRLL